MPQISNCTILSLSRGGPAVDLRIRAPELAAAALPGQFLHIKCDAYTLRRPISICDAGDGEIRLLFEVRGKGTAYLADRRPGETLDVMGPLGNGFSLPEGPVLVAGGGIGIPPLYYAGRRCAGEVHAALGFRSSEHILLLREFSLLCASTAVTTDDGSFGERGYVDRAVADQLARRPFEAVLACGPLPMLRAVGRVCAEQGVPLQVSLEERMGCGIGACLVCACKAAGSVNGDNFVYRHVCKDGPVFPAEEVLLDD